MSQEKLQIMVMQTFWRVIEVYYGIVQVVNRFILMNAQGEPTSCICHKVSHLTVHTHTSCNPAK